MVDVVPVIPPSLAQFTDATAIDRAADYGMVYDTSAGVMKGIFAGHLLDWVARINLAGNTSLVQATHQNRIITNSTASGLITITLWDATVGSRVVFRHRAAFTMRIAPFSGAQYIHTGAAGNYMDILGDGQIALFCHDAGRWDIERASASYQMQNYVPPVTGGLVNGEW